MAEQGTTAVRITNLSRRMITLAVPDRFTKQLVGSIRHNPQTRDFEVRGGRKRLPETMTLLAAGTSGDSLVGPPSLLSSPDVVANRRDLKIETLTATDVAALAEADAKAAALAAANAKTAAEHAAIKAKKRAAIADAIARPTVVEDSAPKATPSSQKKKGQE